MLGKLSGQVKAVGFGASKINRSMSRSDLPVHVVKIHGIVGIRDHDMDFTRLLHCYRDIRDVVCSAIKMKGTSFNRFKHNNSGIERFITHAIEQFEYWTKQTNVYSSRYEDLVVDVAGEVSDIAKHLGIEVDAEQVAEIANKLSVDKQTEYLNGLGKMSTYDRKTLMHPKHIADGKVGKWKNILTPQQVVVVENIARHWLKQNGYSLSGDQD
jgi:hypothetical protein